jgi:hypothetical protein
MDGALNPIHRGRRAVSGPRMREHISIQCLRTRAAGRSARWGALCKPSSVTIWFEHQPRKVSIASRSFDSALFHARRVASMRATIPAFEVLPRSPGWPVAEMVEMDR